MIITEKMLRKRNVCPSQIARFRETFPRGARLTLANLGKAHAAGLSVHWLARLMPAGKRGRYKRLRKAALDAYLRARDAALADLERARETAWADYLCARGDAQDEFERICDAALVAALLDEEDGN